MCGRWSGVVLACSALAVVPLCAGGQVATEAQIEKRIEELKRVVPAQLEEAARRAGVQNRRVDTARVPAMHSDANPAAIAERYRSTQQAAAVEQQGGVMVFASFSMPGESLRRLAQDAARAGVPLYFRGLRYGFGPGKTQRGLAELQPLVQLGASVQIHPEAFEAYSVRSVPAFVVSAAAAPGCGASECSAAVGAVVGDVSLGYALEKLAERQDAVGQIARSTLRQMWKGPRR